MGAKLRHRILQLAPEHDLLLSQIADSQYAPILLKEQEPILQQLKSEFNQVNKDIEILTQLLSNQKPETQSPKGSPTRKFLHRISGRTSSDSLEIPSPISHEDANSSRLKTQLLGAQNRRTYLESVLTEEEFRISDLRQSLERYEELCSQYDELNKSIFGGPNPEYPEEDELEESVRRAEESHYVAQITYNGDYEAMRLLSEADYLVTRAQSLVTDGQVEKLHNSWTSGLFNKNKQAVQQALSMLEEVKPILIQACNYQPALKFGSEINRSRRGIPGTGDVLFDSLISYPPTINQDKNKKTMFDIKVLQLQIQTELTTQQGRVSRDYEIVIARKKELERLQEQLDSMRKTIFKRVVGQMRIESDYKRPQVWCY